MEAKKEFTGHKHKREESKSFTVSKVTKENVITITDDEELLEALKHNNKVSSSMKQEIREIEKLDEANKNMTFKKEKQCFEENDEYDEVLDEDMDYLYYYEPICVKKCGITWKH